MTERNNRQFTHPSKPMYLAMPMKTMLEQSSRSAGGETGRLARRSQFATETRTDGESLEQRQRVIVWCLMALLWILVLIAGIILWDKTSLGF
jgi:hypothetical protein